MTRKNEQGLTDKQAAFVREYLASNNATRAAIAAGYSPNGARVRGNELVTNSNVQAALQAEQARLQRDCDWDVAEKKRRLRYVFEQADKGNPVTDRYGNPTGEYQRNYAAMVKSVEVMGRFDGELTERRDVTTRQAVVDTPLADLRAQQVQLIEQLRTLGLDEHGQPLAQH